MKTRHTLFCLMGFVVPAIGLVALSGCDTGSVTFAVDYEVRDANDRIVTQGRGNGTLGSDINFGQGANAVGVKSRRKNPSLAHFAITFPGEVEEEIDIALGDATEVSSPDKRILLHFSVNKPN